MLRQMQSQMAFIALASIALFIAFGAAAAVIAVWTQCCQKGGVVARRPKSKPMACPILHQETQVQGVSCMPCQDDPKKVCTYPTLTDIDGLLASAISTGKLHQW